jgi:hypothetical protein
LHESRNAGLTRQLAIFTVADAVCNYGHHAFVANRVEVVASNGKGILISRLFASMTVTANTYS